MPIDHKQDDAVEGSESTAEARAQLKSAKERSQNETSKNVHGGMWRTKSGKTMITEAAVSFEPTIAPVYHGSAALVCWPTGCPLLQRRAPGASRMANAKTLVELQYVLQHHFDRAEAAHQRAARPSVMLLAAALRNIDRGTPVLIACLDSSWTVYHIWQLFPGMKLLLRPIFL